MPRMKKNSTAKAALALAEHVMGWTMDPKHSMANVDQYYMRRQGLSSIVVADWGKNHPNAWNPFLSEKDAVELLEALPSGIRINLKIAPDLALKWGAYVHMGPIDLPICLRAEFPEAVAGLVFNMLTTRPYLFAKTKAKRGK